MKSAFEDEKSRYHLNLPLPHSRSLCRYLNVKIPCRVTDGSRHSLLIEFLTRLRTSALLCHALLCSATLKRSTDSPNLPANKCTALICCSANCGVILDFLRLRTSALRCSVCHSRNVLGKGLLSAHTLRRLSENCTKAYLFPVNVFVLMKIRQIIAFI